MSSLLSGACLASSHHDCTHLITTAISSVFIACECACHPPTPTLEMEAV